MTARLLALFVAMFVAAVPAWAATPPAAEDPEPLVALLRAGRVDDLERRMAALHDAYVADTDAEWAFGLAISGFRRVDTDLEPRFEAWVKAYPRSHAAWLARAASRYQQAWLARGTNYAPATADQRLDRMRRELERMDADLDAAVPLSPRPQLAHRYRILGAMTRGDAAAVRRHFDAAMKADPENWGSRRAVLQALRPEWGGSPGAMVQLVESVQRQGDTPKLRAVAARLHALVLAQKGQAAERARDEAGALAAYDAAVAVGDSAEALLARGRFHERMRRVDAALQDFDAALALDPTLGEAWEHRAIVRERHRRQMPEAVADYARAASYGREWSVGHLGILLSGSIASVKPDRAASLRWAQLGASYGDASSKSALGYHYYAGETVPRDLDRALALWMEAAAQGDERATLYLAAMPWWMRAKMQWRKWFGA